MLYSTKILISLLECEDLENSKIIATSIKSRIKEQRTPYQLKLKRIGLEELAKLILKEVNLYYRTNLPYQMLFKKTRKREIVTTRHFFYVFQKQIQHINDSNIKDFFNQISHATVIHGRKKIKNLLESKDKEITQINKNIIQKLIKN